MTDSAWLWTLSTLLAFSGGFLLAAWLARTLFQNALRMFTAAAKVERIEDLTRRTDLLLSFLKEHQATEQEWTARVERMDVNQAKILDALLRMHAIRVEAPGTVSGLIVGSRPGMQDPSPPANKPGRARDEHI